MGRDVKIFSSVSEGEGEAPHPTLKNSIGGVNSILSLLKNSSNL
jgi:hypothetical protein